MHRGAAAILNAVWRRAIALTRPSPGANRRRLARRGESAEDLVIRAAAVDDIPALAALHVATWNATYALMGARGPDAAVRERQWRDAFARAAPEWLCLVVERPGGRLVGFAQADRSANPRYDGELRRVHLLRDYQRLGIGRRLVARVARHFVAHGVRSMWLFADARNPSNRAWEALGAVRCDPGDPGSGNYGWDDVAPLARLPD